MQYTILKLKIKILTYIHRPLVPDRLIETLIINQQASKPESQKVRRKEIFFFLSSLAKTLCIKKGIQYFFHFIFQQRFSAATVEGKQE